MEILITTEQFKTLTTLITEDGNDWIDLNKSVDLGKVSSLSDFKTAIKTTGLQHSKDTKSRERGLQISKVLSKIESINDKEIFEKYFIKISELISKYKKGSYSLKKLSEIVSELSEKDINVAKQQVEDIIDIFEDPRFGDKHKKKLINILTNTDEVDLDKFYEETKKAYADYENSFAEGELSPFSIFRTSPSLKVLMEENFSYNNMDILASEFNEKGSDLEKVIYVLNKISDCRYFSKTDDFVKMVFQNIKFRINFNFSPENIKADLKLKDSLIYQDRFTKKVTQVGKKGDFIEVKYKPYKNSSYLSEFFKVDASNKNYKIIMQYISTLPKVDNSKKIFETMMSSLSNNLMMTIKSSDGEKIINHLTENLAGMIFKNNIFIPKKSIKFFWFDKGYANRSRLSIWYEVDQSPDLYKIAHTGEIFSRYVYKP